jgi:aminopeptidase N
LKLAHEVGTEGQIRSAATTRVLELTEAKQSFVFTDVQHPPIPSLLRHFSAPVVMNFDYSDDQLAFLLAHDSDPFNRWEAGQRLATRRLLSLAATPSVDSLSRSPSALDGMLLQGLSQLISDTQLDPAFRDLALTLPSEIMLAEQSEVINPQAIHRARRALRRHLAEQLKAQLFATYQAHQLAGPYSPDPLAAGRRALRNTALLYLAELASPEVQSLVRTHCETASNMTDRIAALSAWVHKQLPGWQQALSHFYAEFESDALVIDKWFSLQAMAPTTGVAEVRALMKHPAFTLKNPNRARSLLFAFCNSNPAQFHASDGRGHAFWAEQVIALDAINPQVAARLARALDQWRKYTAPLQQSMRAALERVAAAKLSNDVAEVIGKALA